MSSRKRDPTRRHGSKGRSYDRERAVLLGHIASALVMRTGKREAWGDIREAKPGARSKDKRRAHRHRGKAER